MVNTNLDTTPLPPNNLVAQDPQSAELAGYVRTKTFGRDVRESIARSIELNSTRSKSAEILANETVNVANDLTERFNAQIGALTEDSELIDARGGKATLGQRLDDTDEQLVHMNRFYVNKIMETNNLTSLQEVFDFIPSNSILIFDKLYEITEEIVLSKNAVILKSEVPATLTTGGGIKNTGSGNCLRVTGLKVKLEGLLISGNGDPYNFGLGATGGNGVVFDAASNWAVDRCHIIGHGGHGITTMNGVWIGRVTGDSVIYGNKKTGIHAVSTGIANNQQNGNNIIINGNTIAYNGENGIEWRSAQLSVRDNDIEQNNGAGILFDLSTGDYSSVGAIVTGNYVEQNYGGQIRVISGSYGIRGLIIDGNYFNASYTNVTSPKALILFEGAQTNQFVEIRNNTYSIINSYIDTYVDGGNTLSETCEVVISGTKSFFKNLGDAKITELRKTTHVLSGLFNQKGISWSTINKSDNQITIQEEHVSGFYYLPIKENDLLMEIRFLVESDAEYTVDCYLYEGDPSLGNALSSVQSDTKTFPAGKNIYKWVLNRRANKNSVYYARIIMSKNPDATELYLYDLEMSVV